MKKRRDDLLEELATFLDTLPAHALRMGTWVASNDPGAFPDQAPPPCGTAACAAAWGCMLPGWQAAGFKLARDLCAGGQTAVHYPVWRPDPALERGLPGFEGLQAGLNLKQRDCWEIFSPATYAPPPTPAAVAARIRHVIATPSRTWTV